jgi:hypothetical protein
MVGRDFGHSRRLYVTDIEGCYPSQRQWHPSRSRGSGPLDSSRPTLPSCPKKAGTRIEAGEAESQSDTLRVCGLFLNLPKLMA